MRPSLPACLLALGGLLAAAPAAASPNYPNVIASELGLSDDKIPECTLCHATDAGGDGTVITPFGKFGLDKRNLAGSDTDSLKIYLKASEAEKIDSDGDGVIDVQELKDGTDPNTAPGGVSPGSIEAPEYGCAASTAPRGQGAAAGLLVGLVLLARRRR